jgi:signal transduction histidine kinase/CheY-like chemotaxis protein
MSDQPELSVKVLDRIDEELLRMSAEQVEHAPFTILFSMGIIAYLMSLHFPAQPWIWAGWLFATVVAQILRRQLLMKLSKEHSRPPSERIKVVGRVNLANTLIHMLSFLSFPLMTPYEASVLTMIFLGMGTGSIVTTLGYAPFARQYLHVALAPLFLLWAWSGLMGSGGVLALLVALVGFAYVGSMTLISQRLYQMAKELYNNRERLAVALEEAEAAGMSKTRFLAAASHDLRQPIHSLSLFVAALGLQKQTPRASELTENIVSAVAALSSQMDALLDISKLDAGVVPVEIETFDLTETVERIGLELQRDAQAANVKLNVVVSGSTQVSSDPRLLERIIRNLVTNALTHNRDCEVVLGIERADSECELVVSDTGVGIPLEQQQRIFDEFYQVHNQERDRSNGLGLGLSIVKRLAKLLDLRLSFESREGAGTSFRFTLPIVDSEVGTSPQLSDATTATESLRVLVLDDDRDILKGMESLLTSLGNVVRTAETPAQGLAIAREWEPEIALVDFRLRGESSGLHFISQLRELFPGTPALLISGDTAPERLLEASNAGITLLHKPVSHEKLIAAISREYQNRGN